MGSHRGCNGLINSQQEKSGRKSFFMAERQVDRAWIREKTKNRQLDGELGWTTKLVVTPVLGHLAHTRIEGIRWIQLAIKRCVIGLGAIQMSNVMLSGVLGADAIE